MGRDVSVVSTHAASLKPSVRSIIDADDRSGLNGEIVRYSVKPAQALCLPQGDGKTACV